ncbi:hypothetical protein H9P43_003717 [Blastocladiella emersonii ATCC 22665]|nr:hypothetical protein H9P43_003717 [Blastocladiella emersonii ATCC 22665]
MGRPVPTASDPDRDAAAKLRAIFAQCAADQAMRDAGLPAAIQSVPMDFADFVNALNPADPYLTRLFSHVFTETRRRHDQAIATREADARGRRMAVSLAGAGTVDPSAITTLPDPPSSAATRAAVFRFGANRPTAVGIPRTYADPSSTIQSGDQASAFRAELASQVQQAAAARRNRNRATPLSAIPALDDLAQTDFFSGLAVPNPAADRPAFTLGSTFPPAPVPARVPVTNGPAFTFGSLGQPVFAPSNIPPAELQARIDALFPPLSDPTPSSSTTAAAAAGPWSLSAFSRLPHLQRSNAMPPAPRSETDSSDSDDGGSSSGDDDGGDGDEDMDRNSDSDSGSDSDTVPLPFRVVVSPADFAQAHASLVEHSQSRSFSFSRLLTDTWRRIDPRSTARDGQQQDEEEGEERGGASSSPFSPWARLGDRGRDRDRPFGRDGSSGGGAGSRPQGRGRGSLA